MKHHRIRTNALLLFIVPMLLFGENKPTGTLKGYVYDAKHTTLLGATVVIKGTYLGSTTDTEGAFIIEKVPDGKWTIIVSMIGYRPVERSVDVTSGRETKVIITLEESLPKLDEIVVTATRTKHFVKDVPVLTTVIPMEEIAMKAATNLEEAMKNVTGVKVRTLCSICNASEIEMQGLPGGYTKILIDGVPIVSGLSSVYGLAQIPAEEIERIEIIKGAGSSLYGSDAIAGVVNVITRKPLPQPHLNLHGSIGTYGTQNLGASFSGMLDHTGSVVSISKIRSNGADFNGDGISETVRYDRIGIMGKIIQELGPTITVTGTGNYLQEDRLGGYRFDPTATLNEQIATQRWEMHGIATVGPATTMSLTLHGLATHHQQQALFKGIWYNAFEDIKGIDIQGTTTFHLHTITMGGIVQSDHIAESSRIGDLRATNVGIFAQDEVAINRLRIVFGGRFDKHSEYGSQFSPRISAMYTLLNDVTLRASYGLGFKVPTLFFEEMHYCPGGFRYTILRNPNLVPERSKSLDFGFTVYRSQLFLSINGFFNNIQNIIEGTVVGWDSTARRLEFSYINVGRARTRGVEVDFSYRINKHITLDGGYSYLDAVDLNTGEFLPFRSKHSAHMSAEYHANQISGAIVGEFIGSMRTENVGSTLAGEEIIYSKWSPNYTLWNANFSWNVSKHYTISVGVDNIFDFTQSDLLRDTKDTEYIWGPIRGRYLYTGISIKL